MKIAINSCIGGFKLSEKACKYLGLETVEHGYPLIEPKRNDPNLIKCIETMGKEADTEFSRLVIVEIPDDVEFYIDENECGFETIHECHRIWGKDQ